MWDRILVTALEGAVFALIGYGIWRFKKLMDDSAKAEKESKEQE